MFRQMHDVVFMAFSIALSTATVKMKCVTLVTDFDANAAMMAYHGKQFATPCFCPNPMSISMVRRTSQTRLGKVMQKLENGKQKINALLDNYGPVGPRHLLAAALLMRPREDESKLEKKTDNVAA
jgi:hypothetical protein